MLDLNNCLATSVDHSYHGMDWNQREENILQTVFHLNTKSADCVRAIVDVVGPCSRVEPQKACEKWSLVYVWVS